MSDIIFLFFWGDGLFYGHPPSIDVYLNRCTRKETNFHCFHKRMIFTMKIRNIGYQKLLLIYILITV